MPLFDFACKKCGTVFEFMRPFGSKVNPPCPSCKSKQTEKKIAPPAIHFKGSGFYKTDSSSKPETTAAPAPAPKKETKAEPKTPPPEKKSTPPAKE